jgi:hypothetical protein
VTHLRKRMLEELQRRNYTEGTTRAYLQAVQQFEGTQLLTEIDNPIESNLSRTPPVCYSTPLYWANGPLA